MQAVRSFLSVAATWLFAALIAAGPAFSQDTLMGGAGGYAVSGGAANSCWDLTAVNSPTDVTFTNGGCTATLLYGGEDLHFELTPANKAAPTIAYFEVRADVVNTSGSFGVPGARMGLFFGNDRTSVRPGFQVSSLGNTFDGTMTHNFASLWTADSKLTFATGSIMSIVVDRTTPTHPLVYMSNDGVTYRSSGDVLNDMATCCGTTLVYGGASLFVAGDRMTILTGTAITRTPKAGSTVLP